MPIRKLAALLVHGERFMAHLSLVRHSLARLEDARETARVDPALAEAVAALRARLDLAATDADNTGSPAAEAAGIELLPAEPPTHDVVPWLTRRLKQLVDEADDIRAAARASLAGRA